jgi:hypothetical protein
MEALFAFDLGNIINRTAKKRPRTKQATPREGRHVVWNPGAKYVCIRQGRPIQDEVHAKQLLNDRKTDESYFYIFCSTDPNVQRNQFVPKFEAAYFCSARNYFIKVQMCHLKQAYANARRTDSSLAFSLMEDNTPYWVDRFAISAENLRLSRKRYKKK